MTDSRNLFLDTKNMHKNSFTHDISFMVFSFTIDEQRQMKAMTLKTHTHTQHAHTHRDTFVYIPVLGSF